MGEKWKWDSSTRTRANSLRHTFTNFGHIVNFLCVKELMEPMRPLLSSLHGTLVEVIFGFQKITEVQVAYMYRDVENELHEIYQVLHLAETDGSRKSVHDYMH